jgi:hypothetical protein
MRFESDALQADIRCGANLTGQIILEASIRLAGDVDDIRFDLDRNLSGEIRCGLLFRALERILFSDRLGESDQIALGGIFAARPVAFDPIWVPLRVNGHSHQQIERNAESPAGRDQAGERAKHVGKTSGNEIGGPIALGFFERPSWCHERSLEFRGKNGSESETYLGRYAT